ncbi:M3 family oligoendopeptidase [bacterium]|nr:M3 family oligoendopeptidase [bacterium]
MPSPIAVERPGDYPRRYVPADADLADWPTLEALLAELEARPLDSPTALTRWMEDCDELYACLGEESARRHIEMTCATSDPVAESRHLHMINEIWPKAKPIGQRLSQKYLACPHRRSLDRRFLFVHDRDLETEVKLFRQANVELEKEDAQMRQQYQKIMGAMTVVFRGEEKTLQQMAIHLESTDRAEREEAWRLVADRRLADRQKLDELYGRMVHLRHRIAENADYPDYVEYIFPKKLRFDYTPADCEAFHEAVETCAVPFMRRINARRKKNMGLSALRPWDLSVDELGRPPLRPFQSGRELSEKCQEVFRNVDRDFGGTFLMMIDRGLLDLDSRKGKAPGGYQSTLSEVRLPFIFMNAAGTNNDLFTLLHEGGHAFHSMAARDISLLSYRHAPLEFCEVASMGMELLCCDKLEPFYDDGEAARSLRQHLEGTVMFFPWCATIDAFQHWIYRRPEHTPEERRDAWRGLVARFGHDVDWSGLEDARDYAWHRQSHLFTSPFYYIEYGIAQMGALQLWVNYRHDPKQAVAQYKQALALGGGRPLPELFATAGLAFDLSKKTLEPLVAEVERALAALPE